MRTWLTTGLVVTGALALSAPAMAEPMTIEAVMSPTQSMKLDFKDDSKRFVLLVVREGEAEGTGPLAGGTVIEYGMHPIHPGVGGDPQGFLEVSTPDGAVAYIRWTVKAVFVKGDPKPRLVDYGHWELIGGTGALGGMRGVGTLTIKGVSPTDRLFTLDGEIAPAP